MGRGGLGSTGSCCKRQVGNWTNQVPRPLSSLSQQKRTVELTPCAVAPGLLRVLQCEVPGLQTLLHHTFTRFFFIGNDALGHKKGVVASRHGLTRRLWKDKITDWEFFFFFKSDRFDFEIWKQCITLHVCKSAESRRRGSVNHQYCGVGLPGVSRGLSHDYLSTCRRKFLRD